MNKTFLLCVFICAIGIIKCTEQEKDVRLEPVTTSLLASALTSVAVNLFQGLLSHLFKPSDYQDTLIFDRSMRIKMCGETCVQITDRASSITTTGTGATLQEALGVATKNMFDELLIRNLLSLHDLCNLNIVFPHPNTLQCAGQVINPCDLLHPVLTTPTPCINKLGDIYCSSNAKRCGEHLYQSFMQMNCWKTCTNGTCTLNSGPVNPCKV
ncbi:unnamed protein product [Brachionus calyciflorus]|uniref:Uncharacterized protein n=1 Tax=Brachionus calyciflorus TaxID=104777 RepID=A0A813V2H4_9BILA|nr:unnamed protein product [Brachionus calyciflorus]